MSLPTRFASLTILSLTWAACSNGSSGGACAPDSAECASPQDCCSGNCSVFDGICYFGMPCAGDADCPGAEVCNDGHCGIPLPCKSDADCKDGDRCDTIVSECLHPCASNADCAANRVCDTSGFCR